eukprot:363837-Chlamydomonas_euryale.AAC.4
MLSSALLHALESVVHMPTALPTGARPPGVGAGAGAAADAHARQAAATPSPRGPARRLGGRPLLPEVGFGGSGGGGGGGCTWLSPLPSASLASIFAVPASGDGTRRRSSVSRAARSRASLLTPLHAADHVLGGPGAPAAAERPPAWGSHRARQLRRTTKCPCLVWLPQLTGRWWSQERFPRRLTHDPHVRGEESTA